MKEREIILSYENDDMFIELIQIDDVYCVRAESFDGQLETLEEFSRLAKAAALYEFIRDNYDHSPPGDELEEFINNLLSDGRYN